MSINTPTDAKRDAAARDVLTDENVLPVWEQISKITGYACAWFPRVANASNAQGVRGGKLVIYDLVDPAAAMTCYTLDDFHAYRPTLRDHSYSYAAPKTATPKTAAGGTPTKGGDVTGPGDMVPA